MKTVTTKGSSGIYYYDLTFQNEGENVPEITFAPTTSTSSAYPHSCIPPQSTRGSIWINAKEELNKWMKDSAKQFRQNSTRKNIKESHLGIAHRKWK